VTPTLWVTPHYKSQVVLSALHVGTGFDMRPIHEAPFDPGPSVVYGVLRGCSEIIRRCEASGAPYWHIDHGYFKRSVRPFDGYFRISKNALQAVARAPDGKRWKALDIKLGKWGHLRGSKDYIIPPTLPIMAHFGVDWEPPTQGLLNPVIARKGEVPFVLSQARSVTAFNSNCAVEAVVAGVPARQEIGVVGRRYFSTEFRHIPNRDELVRGLAYGQFTLDEMRSGLAWELVEACQNTQ